MALLTPRFLQRIRAIIQRHHTAFIANAFGPDTVPSDVVAELRKRGLIKPDAGAALEDAYLYGQAMSHLEDPAMANWSQAQVAAWIKKNPIPLTAAERAAVNAANMNAAIYCQGLGNTVEKDTGKILVDADQDLRDRLKGQIKDETARNIQARETVKQLKTELGHATQDWARDLDRIAITEKQNAMQAGVADGIEKKSGPDARVYIAHPPDACPTCLRLTMGPDGAPRIFKLFQLGGPGANVKKKQVDWIPCVGAIHPHCRAELSRLPQGWGFNEAGEMVPNGEYGVEAPEEEEKSFRDLLGEEQTHWDALRKARKLAGKITFQGLPISIEQDKGDARRWKDRHGNSGTTVMKWPYGYVRGSEGVDGDAVDVYVGPNPNADHAFIIHQRKKSKDGNFYGLDEQKCMLGFSNAEEAKAAYLAHYDDPGFFGSMDSLPMEDFKEKVLKTKTAEDKKVSGIPIVFPEHRFEIPLGKALLNIPQNGGSTVSSAVGGVTMVSTDPAVHTGSGHELQSRRGEKDHVRPIGGENDVVGYRDYLLSGQPRTSVIYRDPKIYEFDADTIDYVLPIDLNNGVIASAHDTLQPVERENTERTMLQATLVPRNTANPGWEPQSGKLSDQPPLPPVQQKQRMKRKGVRNGPSRTDRDPHPKVSKRGPDSGANT